jgi:hypothetical protein
MAKHRTYNDEITVYVWKFVSTDHPGHAALKIRSGLDESLNSYISWWPGGEGAQPRPHEDYKYDMLCEMSPRTRERLVNNEFPNTLPGQRTIKVGENDIWVQGAHYQVKLPAVGTTRVQGGAELRWGLNLKGMQAWWSRFKTLPHQKYKMMSRQYNCSAVVKSALLAAGAHYIVPAPVTLFPINPNDITGWAKALETKLDRLNQGTTDLINRIQNRTGQPTIDPIQIDGVDELITVYMWRALSDSYVTGLVKTRSHFLRQIDQILDKYHQIGWDSKERRPEKIQLLGDLMDAIREFLANRAKSERVPAVLALAKHVLKFMSRKQFDYMKDFDDVFQNEVWFNTSLF